MIKVKISDKAEVNTRQFPNKQTGELMSFYDIEAWADLGGEYPEKIKLNLESNAPIPAGDYEIGIESFYVGKFASLTLGTVKLKPIKVASKVPALKAS